MKKFILAAVLFCTSTFMTGCVNSTYQEKVVSVEKIEKHLVKNETTLNDLRALLSTPAIIGKTKDDNKKIAGFIIRTSMTTNLAKNIGKGLISFGFMSKSDPMVQKNVIVKLDENDVLTDYAFDGYSYIMRHRVGFWNQAERALTQEELYSSINYDDEEILTKYKEALAKEKIDNGEALEKLCQMVKAQGGDDSYIRHPEKFEVSKNIIEVKATNKGYIKEINALEIGEAAMRLGAGRATIEDVIDPKAGIILNKKVSDYVNIGDTLCVVHTDINDYDDIIEDIKKSYKLSDVEVKKNPIIYEIIQ